MANPSSVLLQITQFAAEHRLGARDLLPSERELSRRLSVSRPALREATRRLVELGIVETKVGAGTYVASLDIEELLEVRLVLEPMAARLAADNASGAQRRELSRLLEELIGVVDEPECLAELDIRIHALIATASGNRVLNACLKDLEYMLQMSRTQTVDDPERRASAVSELSILVDAITGGRAKEAATAMRRHIQGVRMTASKAR